MTIVICKCKNAGLVPEKIVNDTLDLLQKTSQKVYCVDDLCALAAAKDPLLKKWSSQDDLVVLACYRRAVKALFSHAGTDLSTSTRVINLRIGESPDSDFSHLPADSTGANEPQIITASDSDWVPWFPIIDYHRCKNCKQCLNFCLFGVYSQQEKTADASVDKRKKIVEVMRPQKCKTGCPACARVCPYAAIIFPKYDKSPINGDEVNEAQWRISHAESAESLKDRLSAGNIYGMLRNRKPGAEQTNPQNLEDLEKLKDQFDIPDELFDSQNKSDS